MKTVTLTLEEIVERRREALQAGKHHVVRLWEELERRAREDGERERDTGGSGGDG